MREKQKCCPDEFVQLGLFPASTSYLSSGAPLHLFMIDQAEQVIVETQIFTTKKMK